MSILDRISLNRHLDDAALAQIWTDATLAPGEAHANAHLDVCPSCRARYEALDEWLQDVGSMARAEADEAFPAERLAAQQSQILRRIEALERPARIILFPKHTRPAIGERTGARRCFAAAAAAGLVVGIAAGQLLDLRDALGQRDPMFTQQRQPEATRTTASFHPVSLQGDEAFLGDLEEATQAPVVPELAALDAFTPRLRDIGPERSQ